MDKYQEALEYIKHDLEHNDFIRYKNGNQVDKYHREVLRKLVDKETPKETVFDLENYMFYGLCPNCKSWKVADYEYDNVYNHCSDCGQKLSWDNHEGVNNKAIDWGNEE